MDLLQTVRKEGSRGGVDFKWDDVRSSQHRENYLGHSLMAPVGRWQKGRDLNWYAKAGDAEKTPEEIEAEEKQRRNDELKKVKEAEEDAMARALGLPVPDRSANTEPLGENRLEQKDVQAALKEALYVSDDQSKKTVSSKHKHDRERAREHKRYRRDRHADKNQDYREHSRSRSRSHSRDRMHRRRPASRSHDRARTRQSRSYSRERAAEDRHRRTHRSIERSRSRSRDRRRRRNSPSGVARRESDEPRRHDRSRSREIKHSDWSSRKRSRSPYRSARRRNSYEYS